MQAVKTRRLGSKSSLVERTNWRADDELMGFVVDKDCE